MGSEVGMNEQASLPDEYRGGTQIRNWTRFPPDQSETVLLIHDEPAAADVLNVSFGGVGVTVELVDSVDVQVGNRLSVLYHDHPMWAQVQWIERNQAAQRLRLGLVWCS
jgi:hypothetical protein